MVNNLLAFTEAVGTFIAHKKTNRNRNNDELQ